MTVDIVCNKLQELFGNEYVIMPYTNFITDYTTARQVEENGNIGYVQDYTNGYAELRKTKVIGIVNLQNPQRANTNLDVFITSGFKVDFQVPLNVIKRDANNVPLESAYVVDSEVTETTSGIYYIYNENTHEYEPKVLPRDYEEYTVYYTKKQSFYQKFEEVSAYIRDNDIILSEATIITPPVRMKMVLQEPTYNAVESDGETKTLIFTSSGTMSMGVNATYGSDYKVELFVDGSYRTLDGVNSYAEMLENNNNAIVKQDTTKINQNLSQLGWACTVNIDDIETTNKARQLLFSIVHENREILNSGASQEQLKRKIKTRIINNKHGIVKYAHEFNAIVSITFRAGRNNVGTYDISFTDDNKGVYYTLNFNSDGGGDFESKTVKGSESIGTLPTPTKVGFTFKHWEINGEKINSTTRYLYGANETAVAIYEE